MVDAATLLMDAEALNAFLRAHFPGRQDGLATVDSVSPGHARLSLLPGEAQLRPGGIVSGPTLMTLADTAAYVMTLAHIGPVAMAVTSSLTYQFLRACPVERINADVRLLKLGRRLSVSDVQLWTASPDRLVGQATVAYAIP
jgi:acyl-coenzyme A thioesterase PaaI-like protein